MSRRIALVAALPGENGHWGAQHFSEGLCSALEEAGVNVEVVPVVHDESSYEALLATYARYADLDLSSYDGVLSTNAPGCLARHPNLVCHLLRTARRYYEMFDVEYPAPSPDLRRRRRHIQDMDREALQGAARLFVPGNEGRIRLLKYLGIDSEVLYPFATLSGLRSESYDHLLLPGRLHPWNRADLVVSAMEYVKSPLDLLICGTGENEDALKTLAAGDPRIRFLGRVSGERLAELYSRALGVVSVPVAADFGYVALKAGLCEKPVITCTDSGEPSRIVFSGRTGFVCSPDPREIASCIEVFAQHRDLAAAMGRVGRGSLGHVSRKHVSSVLCDALGFRASPSSSVSFLAGGSRTASPLTLVLDTQPVDPPVEGSRARVLGLYGDTGFPVRYTGAIAEGGAEEEHRSLTATLEEQDVPLSPEHRDEMDLLLQQAGDNAAVDISFPLLGHLSPGYAAKAAEEIGKAGIVIFSRPWSYPLVAGTLAESDALVVYDAHNVEGVLRCSLLDDGASGSELVGFAGELESTLCTRADLILAASHRDRLSFARLYDIPFEKIRVVPNGVFPDSSGFPDEDEKKRLKEEEGLPDMPVAVFLGGASPSNVESVKFILTEAAPAIPDVFFLLAGGAGESADCTVPGNARLTGIVDDERKKRLLRLADVALNPASAKAGMNMKVFDYLAAGLPVLATPAGIRGTVPCRTGAFRLSSREEFVEDLRSLLGNREELQQIASASRCALNDEHCWKNISRNLGALLSRHSGHRRKKKPFFSVVVSASEQPEMLERLLRFLSIQTFRDFEVIVVDGCRTGWNGAGKFDMLDLLYHRIGTADPARLRETGAFLARGAVLAFLDGDCEPSPNWLAAARPWFDDPRNAGLEGSIRTDLGWNDERRRSQSEQFLKNNSAPANFFVRMEAFNRTEGSATSRLEKETGPIARLKEFGEIPCCENAWVFRAPR
jgi:glycosyltransferase involved in cell wall biosynthesis